MKIAVQIYGHLRTFEQTYKSIQKNLLSLYDCDVFLHTWDRYEIGGLNISAPKRPLPPKKYRGYINEKDVLEKINLYYNPKDILVEREPPR